MPMMTMISMTSVTLYLMNNECGDNINVLLLNETVFILNKLNDWENVMSGVVLSGGGGISSSSIY